MILTCPNCGTRYLTDVALFQPAGRKVRCAKCGHVWVQAPPEPEPEPEAVITYEEEEPEPPPAREPAHVRPRGEREAEAPARQRGWGGRLAGIGGWAALAVLVVGIAAATARWREDIAALWPQTASLYAAIGMPVNVRGIEFTGVTYRHEYEDGQLVLAITGKVVNVSGQELPVPPIRISLRDEERRELYHWTSSAAAKTLAAGAESSFLARLTQPPRDARHVEVRFASLRE